MSTPLESIQEPIQFSISEYEYGRLLRIEPHKRTDSERKQIKQYKRNLVNTYVYKHDHELISAYEYGRLLRIDKDKRTDHECKQIKQYKRTHHDQLIHVHKQFGADTCSIGAYEYGRLLRIGKDKRTEHERKQIKQYELTHLINRSLNSLT
jgi:hypothetical protein